MDPGRFQLKQALKTVLAILITLGLLRNEPMVCQLMAGVASGFSMQGLVAKTFRSRLIHICFFIVFYTVAFSLGLLVRDSPIHTAITLVLFGFVVNYIRRFGLERSLSPFLAWALCFLATILPFTKTMDAWLHFYALIIGLIVAGLVSICIFPENYPRLFVENSKHFFNTLAVAMRESRRFFLQERVGVDFVNLPFTTIKNVLCKLIDTNQVMQHSPVFQGYENRINHILIHQYAIFSAYSVLLDAYACLCRNQYTLTLQNRLALAQFTKEFADLFAVITVSNDYTVIKSKCKIPKFTHKFGIIDVDNTSQVLMILNLKLSFDLFYQQTLSLLKNADAI
jgi:hypothetical protein